MNASTLTTEQVVPDLPRPPRRGSGSLLVGALLVAAAAVVAGVIVLVLAGALIFGVSRASDAGVGEPMILEIVQGAPDADIVMNVQAHRMPQADKLLVQAGGPSVADSSGDRVVGGTPFFVSTVISEVGETEIYRWSQVPEADGGVTECIGFFGFTNSVTCGADLSQRTNGVGTTTVGGDSIQEVYVTGAPEGTAWLVVETFGGARVAGFVVDGVGYVEWFSPEVAVGGEAPVRVQGFAADFTVTFTDDLS